MHLIYSKLTSANVMSGKIEDKIFSVEFLPDEKTKVSDKEFKALMAEEDSALSFLLTNGDFVEDAESATSEISSLKGEIKKLEKALKNAEEASKLAESKLPVSGDNGEALAIAKDVFIKAQSAYDDCEDASQKKTLLTAVKKANKDLEKAKKAAKKA